MRTLRNSNTNTSAIKNTKMQAMEEENTSDYINGEVEERVRSDSAPSGNHDNDAFDEKVSQNSHEQDTFKDISSVLEG